MLLVVLRLAVHPQQMQLAGAGHIATSPEGADTCRVTQVPMAVTAMFVSQVQVHDEPVSFQPWLPSCKANTAHCAAAIHAVT